MPTSEETETARRPRRWRRRILIGAVVFVVVLAGYTTWANTRTYTLTTSIDIDAPPEQVWDVLTNRRAYPEWNPYLVSSTGRLAEGSTLTNTVRDADGSETESRPTVVVVEPGEELRWIGKFGPGLLFDGEHSFTLTERGTGTRLVQREDFTGALVPVMQGWLDSNTLPQFNAMNRALKDRVEHGE